MPILSKLSFTSFIVQRATWIFVCWHIYRMWNTWLVNLFLHYLILLKTKQQNKTTEKHAITLMGYIFSLLVRIFAHLKINRMKVTVVDLLQKGQAAMWLPGSVTMRYWVLITWRYWGKRKSPTPSSRSYFLFLKSSKCKSFSITYLSFSSDTGILFLV